MINTKSVTETLFFFVLGGLVVYLGIAIGDDKCREEAVAHGAAAWIVTPSGATEFVWRGKGAQ